MDSLLARMGHARRVLAETFGLRVAPLFVGLAFLNLRVLISLFRLLDPVLFPKLRTTKVQRPVVLVGNPRTGTTFLQRFLATHGIGAGMELFRMVYGSLTLQTLIQPFLPLLEKVSPAKFHNEAAHKTSLSSVETDDVAALFRYFDGFFLYGFFLAHARDDHLEHFDPSQRDTSARDYDWLEGLWKRSLVAHDADRVVAKLFSLGPRLPSFTARFPEARILYMARDPLSTIPSGMSLITGVQDAAFGFWSLPKDKRDRYLERLYQAFVMLLRRFHEDWESGAIPRDQVYVVRYDRMMAEFDVVMDELLDFIDHDPSAELQQTIAAQAEKQRNYKSGHKYDLEKFGLDEDRIRQDCAFFYETFLPPLPHLAED